MKTVLKLVLCTAVLLSLKAASQAEGGWSQIWGPVGGVVIRDSLTLPSRIWATEGNAAGSIYEYDAAQKEWAPIGGPGKMFAANAQKLYGLSPKGAPADLDGVWEYSGTPNGWDKIGGPAGKIYAGGNKLYVTNPTSGAIWEYQGKPSAWVKVGEAGKMLAVGSGGQLYRLAPGGIPIYRYTGQGDNWQWIGQPDGPASGIYAGGSKLYATNAASGEIYEYQGSPGSWVKIGGAGKMFAVSGNGQLYGLGPNSVIYRYGGKPGAWFPISGAGVTEIYSGSTALLAVTSDGKLMVYQPIS